MNWETANRLPWNIVLLFGGGFAVALGFEHSGLAVWLGEQLTWIQNVPSIVFILIIVSAMSLLTELTSNVASTQMLLPIFASIALATGNNPLLFMIPATIASSLAFMLPTATPPNAIIFGAGNITINRMLRTGVSLNFLGVLIITLIAYFFIDRSFAIHFNGAMDWLK